MGIERSWVRRAGVGLGAGRFGFGIAPFAAPFGALRGIRPAALLIVVVGVCLAPAFAGAATQEELEARVRSLAEQLEAVKAEVAALKAQRAAANGGSAAPGTATPNSALPDSALPNSALPNSALPNDSVAGTPAASSAATPAYAGTGEGALSWFGYGEINYSRPRDNPSATTADLARFVLGPAYRFDERTRFVSELELEHAVSSAKDSGEIEVEQAYVERELRQGLYAKAGLMLIPSGMLNENHEPTRYYGVFRNFVETAIIPTTWREGGVALQGTNAAGLRWNIGVTTGFDLSKWDAAAPEGQQSPLGSIHQELSLAHARDLSGFGAVNYTGIPALRVGASIFGGGASQGQPGLPSATITLWEGHTRWTPGSWDFAGLYAHGHISGTRQINTTLVGNPTLIPENFFGWYLQTAYRALDRGSWSLTPFVRYERFNTASAYADIAAGLTPAALPDREVWVAGMNLMLGSGVVLKADYLSFRRTSAADRFDLGVGYHF